MDSISLIHGVFYKHFIDKAISDFTCIVPSVPGSVYVDIILGFKDRSFRCFTRGRVYSRTYGVRSILYKSIKFQEIRRKFDSRFRQK